MKEIPKSSIEKIAQEYLANSNSLDFCIRVWNTDLNTYIDRLDAINFRNQGKVLDAGFGLGQWLFALSQMNKEIFGIEYDETRYLFVKKLFAENNINNVSLVQGSVENLPYEDNTFDSVFSYSVILCTDYRKTLQEYYRVLKPNGKLYFNTNGIGWYLYNLLQGHNDSANFSSKQMAINAFNATINYYSHGVAPDGFCIITPKNIIFNDLEQIGFKNIICNSEGCINQNPSVTAKPFFKGEYCDYEGVTEYLCSKQ
jgi:ubiquinone/menaquinone biosynthesis C-methylase UbiE